MGTNVSVQGLSTTLSNTANINQALPESIKSTQNALWTYEKRQIGGERNTTSSTNNYDAVYTPVNVLLCDGIAAVPIGSPSANTTHLLGILILKNAGPATATISGFGKTVDGSTYTAQSFVLSGSTTQDTYFNLHACINTQGPLTVTSSVDECVLVFWRPI